MENNKKSKTKKENGNKNENKNIAVGGYDVISTKADLKSFLISLRDRMAEKTVAPIYAVAAMNHVLNLPVVYDLLDDENKETARDIWLRIRQAGVQSVNPPILFG
jgi:hypothetical protein